MRIAFIPVRGGSKSIPLKNIKEFCTKPLVYWTIKAASESTEIDKVIVATDHAEIKRVVESLNLPKVSIFNRSEQNANDGASTESAMLEYLETITFAEDDIFVLIQATSPFTESHMLSEGVSMLKEGGFDSIISGTRFKRFIWDLEGKPINYDYFKRPRRQDFEGLFLENGAFYISKVKDIIKVKNRISGKIGLYEMPEYTAVEIDEPDDWMICEKLFYRHSKVFAKANVTIKLFLTDVDGVLTDAGMYYSEMGDELKKFSTYDGMAFDLLRNAGIKTGIVTSENTKIVERRAAKLMVDYLYQGKRDNGKLGAAKEICNSLGITLNEVAYIGDDINCFDLLINVGLAACPANAVPKIKKIKHIMHLQKSGGEGAVREFVEFIINKYNT
jgi:N-acylneuraminate cytidylyltransferase